MTPDNPEELDYIFHDALFHYGILRKSGRYPWGSGETPNQRNKQFLDYVELLQSKGLTESQVAEGMGINTAQLRATKAIAKTARRRELEAEATKLKAKGMSNVAIGQQMGLNESRVRDLLNPESQARRSVLDETANMLKRQVEEKEFLDIGRGVSNHLGVSPEKLGTAVAMLKEEGYNVHTVKVKQLGTGEFTTIKVLVPPGTEYQDLRNNPQKIKTISSYSEDGGRTYLNIEPPTNISSKRIAIRYAEEGGADMDGVMQIRRGVEDISLGGAKYAQVRVAVDGTHYLKGMAVYKDDMPDGVDIIFNTNKKDSGNKLDAMKSQKADDDNPFGAIVKQRHYKDAKGNDKLSAMNIVNEEGDWDKWSKNISSQVLSKQSPMLAKQQLDLKLKTKQDEYDEIMALTNPAVRRRLLSSFSDDVDSSAVHLKAAALPRQRTQVILPINSLKDTEIYAPNFRDGERVALVRYPHGGIFEIPELTVNNRNREAGSIMKQAKDAVGINSRVAERLSGADFDGDTVLVIPNNQGKLKSAPALQQLKGFDPKTAYRPYDGMKTIDGGIYNAKTGKAEFPNGMKPRPANKQQKMGDVSNLITDMTIKGVNTGANTTEIARAVKHSMVVIDAEKHHLDYKRSYEENGIAELKKKYQFNPEKGKAGGASTLISRSSSPDRVPNRKPRSARDGGAIDKATGKRVFVERDDNRYINKDGIEVIKTTKIARMALVDNARSLSSGTAIEEVYASHANKMKDLANQSRKSMVETPGAKYNPVARKTYAVEREQLISGLNLALRNAPLERQAQLFANATVAAKKAANPDMDRSDLKKIEGAALAEARLRTGAKKQRIQITPRQWEAIQSGAITNNQLDQILANTDLDLVKQYATPRDRPVMSTAKTARAKAMLASGYTQAEIADALGVPSSTLNDALG